MFRTVPLSVIRSFFTVHTAMVYVIQIVLTACERDRDGTRKLSANLYDIYHCYVTVKKNS